MQVFSDLNKFNWISNRTFYKNWNIIICLFDLKINFITNDNKLWHGDGGRLAKTVPNQRFEPLVFDLMGTLTTQIGG